MRILLVAYCLIDDVNGNSLIGVYKRCLRVGLDLHDRGHDVWILCPDRKVYRDELTENAEQRLNFVEMPPAMLYQAPIDVRRHWFRLAFRRLKPDLVVAGEAPLGGIILEPVLWAASVGVPVAILDNAYGPDFARRFLEAHGPIADAVILSGPSSFQMPQPPAHYCAAPPYIAAGTEATPQQRNDGPPRLTVLAYDRKAEDLAETLLTRLPELPAFRNRPPRAVLFSPQPDACRERLAARGLTAPRVEVLPPPSEDALFAAMATANLVVGKCGFMQITESLSVRTPFIGVHYLGCVPMFLIPEGAREFVHAVHVRTAGDGKASDADVAAAARLLQIPKSRLGALHDGRFDARRTVSRFLEKMPLEPRAETTAECAALGFTLDVVAAAASSLHPAEEVEVRSIRACRLRDEPWGHIDALVCRYNIGGKSWCSNWWGRVYRAEEDWTKEVAALRNGLAGRKLIYAEPRARVLIEDMGDESALPPLRV